MTNFKNNNNLTFNQWFAGLIDGDGSILYSTKQCVISVEITTGLDDSNSLLRIQKRFGGNIKPIKNRNALRWRCAIKKKISYYIWYYYKYKWSYKTYQSY